MSATHVARPVEVPEPANVDPEVLIDAYVEAARQSRDAQPSKPR